MKCYLYIAYVSYIELGKDYNIVRIYILPKWLDTFLVCFHTNLTNIFGNEYFQHYSKLIFFPTNNSIKNKTRVHRQ